ncbi:hypothetical protein LMG27174_06993 [Paraburkholderia rhynchosiae]|uniref:Uncharacterized protein n=1 Tax=Paraburkholderia rhynchosiae TaxID=487049 RepID=A0A6J5CVB8_9BURK|nr:hypothetical protein LMG27174_06993 [Paraburkholderia rhynchosiae]
MQSTPSTVQSASPDFDEARSAEVVNARMGETPMLACVK